VSAITIAFSLAGQIGVGVQEAFQLLENAAGRGDDPFDEGEAAVRVAARRILEQNGFTVLEAPTPRAALDTAARYVDRIDLLLTDLVMPGMSGSELAEQFSRERPESKVLFMSGYTADAVVRRGIFTAGAAYIQKPFAVTA